VLDEMYDHVLAVEMEGYGFLHAVRRIDTKPEALLVRGISDMLSGKAESDAAGSQELAARHAAAFAVAVLSEMPCEPRVGIGLLSSRSLRRQRSRASP
jgi:nucleoside phosphorylase